MPELRWPIAGLNEKVAYRQQPPFSTPSARNVWPTDPTSFRERGGSRGGLSRLIDERFDESTAGDAGPPINMLGETNTDETGPLFVDRFSGQVLGDSWLQPLWSPSSPIVANGKAYHEGTDLAAAVLDAASDVRNAVGQFTCGIDIRPWKGEHRGTYYLFAAMDNSNPDPYQDGIVVALTMTGKDGVWSGSVTRYVGGVGTATAFTQSDVRGYAETGWLSIFGDENGGWTWSVFWGGLTLASGLSHTPVGHRCGFGMTRTASSGRLQVREFQRRYIADTTSPHVTRHELYMVASSTGLVKPRAFNRLPTHWANDISGGVELAPDRWLMSVNYRGQLFVADYGPIAATAGDGILTGGSDEVLSSATIASTFVTRGVTAGSFVVVITDGTGVTPGTYQIASVAAGALTLSSSPSDASTTAPSGITFYVLRSAKYITVDGINVFQLIVPSGSGYPTEQAPSNCKIVANYRDRLILAGDPLNPRQGYASKQGDPFDWDYGADPNDPSNAFSFSATEAGELGEPITACAPWMDDYMVIGCTRSVWVMRGDPLYGGGIFNVSQEHGIVGKEAWCFGAAGEFYFLADDGLYVVPPGAPRGSATSVSHERMPSRLKGLSSVGDDVFLVYDQRHRAVWIILGGPSHRGIDHFAFKLDGAGFWPMRFGVGIYGAVKITDSSQRTTVALACRDGYVRYVDPDSPTDEQYGLDAHCDFGPMQLAGPDRDTIITRIRGSLGADGNGARWSIRRGNNAEAAIGATAQAEGTFVAGRNYDDNPRVGGNSHIIRIESDYDTLLDEDGNPILDEDGNEIALENSGAPWSLEQLTFEAIPGGRTRVA